jgi:ADP-heptose:LPS heptosyltransferase
VRVGFADPWGKPLKAVWSRRFLSGTIYRTAGLDPRGPHECEVLFRLAGSLLGDEKPTRDLEQLRPLVLERDPIANNRVVIQITDKWDRLGVAFEDVVELVRRLSGYGPLRLVSSQSEARYAQRIAESSGIDVSFFDKLEPWKAAIGAAPAIVTPDSGALHVAGMIGTPVIAVFPPGRSYALQAARWAPWAAPRRLIRADPGWPARASDALAQLL